MFKTIFAEDSFILFDELSKLDGINIIMFVVACAVFALFVYLIIHSIRKSKENVDIKKTTKVRAMCFGAATLAISFVLSYIKLFEMPFGGAITLCSMLPVCLYASWYGKTYGFTVAFSYGLLQLVQGAYIVHPVQFMLDYILAYSALGISSFFRKDSLIPVGIFVSGVTRIFFSVLSGVVFFAEYAPQGMNVWAYSFAYNGLSLGTDTLLCIIVYLIPPVRKTLDKIRHNICLM